MPSISWCLKQKDGLKLTEPNENMASSYSRMAEESISELNNIEKSRIWTATMTYYIFYYSLYSLMLRIGVKCEIHTCSIEFMKTALNKLYSAKDTEMIKKAFTARIDLQYYTDRPVDEKIIEEAKAYCKKFYIKTKDILSQITESQINEIRMKLKEELGK